MKTDIKYEKRSLTEEEAGLIVKEIKNTPDITYVRKAYLLKQKNVLVATTRGKFVGMCVCIGIGKKWVKIGPLVVLEKNKGKGIGSTLLEKVLRQSYGKRVYIGSSRISLQQILEKRGFNEIGKWRRLPIRIKSFFIGYFRQNFSAKFYKEYKRKGEGRGEYKHYTNKQLRMGHTWRDRLVLASSLELKFKIDPKNWIYAPAKAIANEMVFDSTLSNHTRQRLEEDKSTVFGLSGNWGKGKSHLIEYILHHIGAVSSNYGIKRVGLIRLNPRKYNGDKGALLYDLLDQLGSQYMNLMPLGLSPWGYVMKNLVGSESFVKVNLSVVLRILKVTILFGLVIWLGTYLVSDFSIWLMNQRDGIMGLLGAEAPNWAQIIMGGVLTALLLPLVLLLGTKSVTKDKLEKLHDYNERINEYADKLNDRTDRIIVVLDNLDRLQSREALDTLDLVRAFFSNKIFIFVISGDQDKLAKHIGHLFKDSHLNGGNNGGENLTPVEFGRRYLKKLFTNTFEIPVAPSKSLKTYCEGIVDDMKEYIHGYYLYENMSDPTNYKRLFVAIEEASGSIIPESKLDRELVSLLTNSFSGNYRDIERFADRLRFYIRQLDEIIIPAILVGKDDDDLPQLYVRRHLSHFVKLLMLQDVFPEVVKVFKGVDGFKIFRKLEGANQVGDLFNMSEPELEELGGKTNRRDALREYLQNPNKFVSMKTGEPLFAVEHFNIFLDFVRSPDERALLGATVEGFSERASEGLEQNYLEEVLSLAKLGKHGLILKYMEVFNSSLTNADVSPETKTHNIKSLLSATLALDDDRKVSFVVRSLVEDVYAHVASLPEDDGDRIDIVRMLMALLIKEPVRQVEEFMSKYLRFTNMHSFTTSVNDLPDTQSKLLDTYIDKSLSAREVPLDSKILLEAIHDERISKRVTTYPQNFKATREQLLGHVENNTVAHVAPEFYVEASLLIDKSREELLSKAVAPGFVRGEGVIGLLKMDDEEIFASFVESLDWPMSMVDLEGVFLKVHQLEVADYAALWKKIASNRELSSFLSGMAFFQNKSDVKEEFMPRYTEASAIMDNVITAAEDEPPRRTSLINSLSDKATTWFWDALHRKPPGRSRFEDLLELDPALEGIVNTVISSYDRDE